jgi:hypothetical protein
MIQATEDLIQEKDENKSWNSYSKSRNESNQIRTGS